MKLYRVVLPHYCCGFLVNEHNIIVRSAPVMRWAVGKTLAQYAAWAESKGGKVHGYEADQSQQG